jgi:hypothetical protein
VTYWISQALEDLLSNANLDAGKLNAVIERRLVREDDARMRPGDYYPRMIRKRTGMPVVRISRRHRRLLAVVESRSPFWSYNEYSSNCCELRFWAWIPETMKIALVGRIAGHLTATTPVVDVLPIAAFNDPPWSAGWIEARLAPVWRKC